MVLVNSEVGFPPDPVETSYLSVYLSLASRTEAAYKNRDLFFFLEPEELRVWVKKSVGRTLAEP